MVINTLLSQSVRGQPEPEIGMGATFLSWSDRSPGTIVMIEKKGGATWIQVQADNYKRTDKNGLSEMQTYEFSRNPEGVPLWFKKLPNGVWQQMRYNPDTGRWRKGETGLRIGERDRYYDFSF